MIRKVKGVVVGALVVTAIIAGLLILRGERNTKLDSENEILGQSLVTSPQPSSNQAKIDTVLSPIGSTEPVPTTTFLSDQFDISIINGPGEIIQNSNAAFTWQITGPSQTINTTTIYWGPVSTPGGLTTSMESDKTKYTNNVLDFMNGNFAIPLRFIGNSIVTSPGTYYYRAYALIDGKHNWSDERSFVVKPEPRYEIKIFESPKTARAGENVTFTWDVYGPAATTGFTVIAIGRQSLAGPLDSLIDLPKTPYSVLVNEFTTGPYTVPLRFIGNAKIAEPGIYYFRALAFINNKNIWSDEYSLTVE